MKYQDAKNLAKHDTHVVQGEKVLLDHANEEVLATKKVLDDAYIT